MQDGQRDVRSGLAADALFRLGQIDLILRAVQHGNALHRDDQVADLESGSIGGALRRHVGDARAALHVLACDRHADADVLVLHGLGVFPVQVGGDIVAPFVADVVHQCRSQRLADGFLVGLADVVAVNDRLQALQLGYVGMRPVCGGFLRVAGGFVRLLLILLRPDRGGGGGIQQRDGGLKLLIVRKRKPAVIEIGLFAFGQGHLLVGGYALADQADAVGRRVFSDGEIDGGAVAELEGGLEIALAVGSLADDFGIVIFLQRGGKEFRGGVGIVVDQHGHRDLDVRFVGIVHGLFSVAGFAVEERALGQDIVEQRHQLALESARIEADVKDDALCAV